MHDRMPGPKEGRKVGEKEREMRETNEKVGMEAKGRKINEKKGKFTLSNQTHLGVHWRKFLNPTKGHSGSLPTTRVPPQY